MTHFRTSFGLLLLIFWLVSAQEVADNEPYYTAADSASWAVSSRKLSTMLGGHKQVLYDDFIASCQEAVKPNRQNCSNDENFRFLMNERQPASVYNYTELGYKKIKAPKSLFDKIIRFYKSNEGKDEVEWKSINTYHNMWDAPPTIMHLNQPRNRGGGAELQAKIWKEAKKLMQEWTGQELAAVSLYGIRLYHNGSILAPHVDRLPLVTSAIINVDQDVEEPWPLEVYGHDGKATNVTMEPGDMVLYESHSVIHGRPFPLNGKFYANVFVHFEPVGPLDPNEESTYDAKADLPPYLIPGSYWETQWLKSNPKGWKGKMMNAKDAARKGEANVLKRIGKADRELLHVKDRLGWQPLHEAVRVGQVECVQILLLNGGNINERTKTGVSPLNIAIESLGKDHKMVKFLQENGAIDIYEPNYEL